MFRKLKSVVVFLKLIVSFVLTRPFNRIAIIWNGIPEDIKVATTLCSFKRQLNLFTLSDYRSFSRDVITF